MATCPHLRLEQLLRGADLRVTRPRLAVLAALHEHPHVDTDALIGARTRASLGDVSHQAVYDVLRALTDAGLVRRIQPAGSVARYESRVGDNHHHVVCRSCGAIADVDCAVGHAPCLTASDDHGFAVDEAEVVYWGTCPDCAAASHQPQLGRKQMSDSQDHVPRARRGGPEGRGRLPGHADSATAHGSESENPAIDSPTPKTGGRPHTNQDWWPNQLDLVGAARPLVQGQPAGRRTSATPRSSRSSTSTRSSATSSRCSPPRRTGGRPTSATTAA